MPAIKNIILENKDILKRLVLLDFRVPQRFIFFFTSFWKLKFYIVKGLELISL